MYKKKAVVNFDVNKLETLFYKYLEITLVQGHYKVSQTNFRTEHD